MELRLERFSYAPTETEGELRVGGYDMFTIERPWIPWQVEGGKPFESCVPDGSYTLAPYTRDSGERVYSMSGVATRVFLTREQAEANGGGRYACLVHTANFVHQVVGCVAPGMSRGILSNKATGSYARAVLNSAEAMRILRQLLGDQTHTLTIGPRAGAGGTQ